MVTHTKTRNVSSTRKELRAVLRYYSPGKEREKRIRWPEAPHLYFTNLNLDERSLPDFAAKFGGPLLKGSESDVQLANDMQRLLRGAWRGDQLSVETLQFGVGHYAEQAAYGPVQIKPVPNQSGGLDIYTSDLWTYIRLAFLADQARTRVCANPGCSAPYFLAQRKDQRVCGRKECTQWAQQQWSLDWWNARGSDLRRAKSKLRKRTGGSRKRQK